MEENRNYEENQGFNWTKFATAAVGIAAVAIAVDTGLNVMGKTYAGYQIAKSGIKELISD